MDDIAEKCNDRWGNAMWFWDFSSCVGLLVNESLVGGLSLTFIVEFWEGLQGCPIDSQMKTSGIMYFAKNYEEMNFPQSDMNHCWVQTISKLPKEMTGGYIQHK